MGDPNVPLVNSYEWYHALRDAGVPVEFYAYPVNARFPRSMVPHATSMGVRSAG